jgi:hypothetical protein
MTYYVAISFGYWGRGKTEPEAIKQCRKAGADKSDTIHIYRIDCEATDEPPYVTNDGTMCWHGERTKTGSVVKGKLVAA